MDMPLPPNLLNLPGTPARRAGRPPAGMSQARSSILTAALQEFAAHGFEATTMAAIARRAQVARALVSYHYNSKETLWRQALEGAFADIAAELLLPVHTAPAITSRADAEARLMGLALRLARVGAAYPAVLRILVDETRRPGPRGAYLINTYLVPLYRAAASLWQQESQGIIDPADAPPHLLIPMLVGVIAHFSFDQSATIAAFGIDPHTPQGVEHFASFLGRCLILGLLGGASSNPLGG